MPYRSINELSDSVRNVLPKHAQEIYKEAYNSAYTTTPTLMIDLTMPVARR
jgi:cation transport regulator ChaB